MRVWEVRLCEKTEAEMVDTGKKRITGLLSALPRPGSVAGLRLGGGGARRRAGQPGASWPRDGA